MRNLKLFYKPVLAFLLLSFIAPCASAERIRAEGLVEAVFDAALSPQVSGIVSYSAVEEGDWVEAGQLLVQLRDDVEALEVRRRKLVLESKVELEAALKKRDVLKHDLVATQSLYENSGTVSQEELELKQLEFDLAEVELKRLEQCEVREEVEYRIAVEQQSLRKLVAPAAGEITRRLIDPGEHISPEQPLLRLVDPRKCTFVCNLPAKQVGRVVLGKRYPLEFSGEPTPVHVPAKVVFVSSVTDAASGLRMVKMEFDNPELLVSPGTRGWLVVE